MACRTLGLFATALLSAVAVLSGCADTEEHAASTDDSLTWEPVSAALGNPPNFAQLGNGSTMSVVSRDWGRGAKAGALVELYYPHYDADNLWDSYVGIASRGQKLRWAHDLTLKNQRMVPDSGLVVTELAGQGFTLTIEDVLRPKNDAHVRHVVVKNTGSRPLEDVDLTFYAYYAIDNLPQGDRLEYRADRGALVQVDNGTAIATVADRPPTATHCGHVLLPFGDHKDARVAAENRDLSPCREAVDAGVGGVNGVLVHRLAAIPAGGTSDISYAIGLGPNADRALGEAETAVRGGFVARRLEDAEHWGAELARAPLPARLPAEARDVYRRAVITVLQHRVDNGGFIAASTLTSPVYKLVWPRDGSKTAVDMLEAGFAPEAKGFFELLEKLQRPDGSFAINYKPDASGAFFDFGREGNENDQPGMLPWGVNRVLEATSDVAWAEARWPAVRRAAEHLLAISAPGSAADGSALVAPSRDLWELETGGSWTYANGSAIAGLEGAAKIARALGNSADAARYDERAGLIRRALEEKLVTRDGWFGRGFKDRKVDERLEIANLALGAGGFGILPDTDPRLSKLGDLVPARLGTPGGAVRRYEGDRYYGGQPWPVASVWLGLHRLARGDRAAAESLFRVMTDQARATPTLMLGEQFDEAKRAWLSAVPLVWSEAAYIRMANALYAQRD